MLNKKFILGLILGAGTLGIYHRYKEEMTSSAKKIAGEVSEFAKEKRSKIFDDEIQVKENYDVLKENDISKINSLNNLEMENAIEQLKKQLSDMEYRLYKLKNLR